MLLSKHVPSVSAMLDCVCVDVSGQAPSWGVVDAGGRFESRNAEDCRLHRD